jgi:type I restriction enzyme M protein
MTPAQLKELENRLWESADTLRANSDLKSSEYATPVLGIIFLKFADNKYSQYEAEINAEYDKIKGGRRGGTTTIADIAKAKHVIYLPPEARYDYLLNLPEEEDIAKALKKAMQLIEEHKPELKDTLPQDEYMRLVRKPEFRDIPKRLLRNFADIPKDATGDMFGQIYEYFLGEFAKAEGQKGGEFFTPRSVVRLMVEIIEPHDGKVFDPACGSGGMFVQSAKFIEEHRKSAAASNDLVVEGMEKTLETVKLAKMNLAVNGLRGEIKQANTYVEDPFKSFGKYDYVLANPPFNVDDVPLAKVESDKRFNTYGIPRNKSDAAKKGKGIATVPNGNYLWINLFATSLKPNGRAGLVMANSASDARHSEADIRQKLIESNLIYAMLTLPSNMFYTVTLPATLWFFDKGKKSDKILFIDARNIFTQIDRAHREFSAEQIQNIAIISRLERGNLQAFVELVHSYFQGGFTRLNEHRPILADVTQRVRQFLEAQGGATAPDFAPVLKEADKHAKAYEMYAKAVDLKQVDKANAAQRKLAESMSPFFAALHAVLKEIDKQFRQLSSVTSTGSVTKEALTTAVAEPVEARAAETTKNGKSLKNLKAELDNLHREAKDIEYFFTHVQWLQERFPEAKYEDVTGLCKLASLEEVKEQEYSLNPGRYVGVVIEEDGKTEEEFIEDVLAINAELEKLNEQARELASITGNNIRKLTGA